MEIIINNVRKTVDESISVQKIVEAEFGEKTKGIAVAIQQKVVPRTEWETTLLNDQDDVLLIRATQGG